jgi:hypothetical protein
VLLYIDLITKCQFEIIFDNSSAFGSFGSAHKALGGGV